MVVELAIFYIAGLQYCSKGLELFLDRDEYLSLKREESNPNDKYAIAIYKDDIKLGYIPKGINRNIYSYLDNDIEIKVLKFNKELPPWERIEVVIFLEE